MTRSTDGEVQQSTCYWIDCSECGEDAWDEGRHHFDSEEELRHVLVESYRWSFESHGRTLCRHCTRSADCERDGHRYDEWRTHPSDQEVQIRFCEHCHGGMEERFTAMAEGEQP